MPKTKKGSASKTVAKKATKKRSKKQSVIAKESALTEPASTEGSFPIVGIGASAGGLEAFETFFKAMPAESGIAFILVTHLDPSHTSILPELLQKSTSMKVHQVKDGMQVRPNEIYVIPPNKDLSILGGKLQLLDFQQQHGLNLPVDSFLQSLAQDQGRNAIGIVLSGTGSDGTRGIKAIKGEAGMVMAQDQDSAKYEGMPRSAIDTGVVDFVMPPEDMPAKLIAYAQRTRRGAALVEAPVEGRKGDALQKIFIILRNRTGHDFSQYKYNTIYRRIERRMNVQQVDTIDEYVRFVNTSEQEAQALFKEFLINVTQFFRDPEAFDVLQNKLFPAMLKEKAEGEVIRVWVPGCSTGEEAYSIAIALQESMRKVNRIFPVQIFGTDIDDEAIDVARAGIYPPNIQSDLKPKLLKRYFVKNEDGRYCVTKSIREMLVFALQNVIKDPPFTKLDMIACRNLLIYLGTPLQRKVLPLFHYALKPDGMLFLGSSETVGAFADLFEAVEKKWKLFTRKPASAALHHTPHLQMQPDVQIVQDAPAAVALKDAEDMSALQMVEMILRQSDTPPCAVIDAASNIVYIHGRTGKFLEPAEGRANANILDMARPGLKPELADALRKVNSDRQELTCTNIKVPHNGGHVFVDLTVKPILEHTAHRNMTIVIFQEVEPSASSKKRRLRRSPIKKSDKTAEELDQELRYTRERLQTAIEELETSNEELKSSNEELQSTNEELQSTNEELETSKEELQSLNEEAATVNAELQSRIDDLARTHDDMKNLLDSIDIAIIFLDVDLNVRRFTPRATQFFPLTSTDIGRPLKHLVSNFDCDINDYAEQVLNDLALRDAELVAKDGTAFRMLVRPYRTVANVIDGVVVTFQDITEIKKAKDKAQLLAASADRHLATVVMDSNDAITVLDADGRITLWNRGAQRMYGYAEREALEMNIVDIVPKGKKEETKGLVARIVRGEAIESFETQRVTKDGRTLEVWLTITKLTDDRGAVTGIATTERDITDRAKARA